MSTFIASVLLLLSHRRRCERDRLFVSSVKVASAVLPVDIVVRVDFPSQLVPSFIRFVASKIEQPGPVMFFSC